MIVMNSNKAEEIDKTIMAIERRECSDQVLEDAARLLKEARDRLAAETWVPAAFEPKYKGFYVVRKKRVFWDDPSYHYMVAWWDGKKWLTDYMVPLPDVIAWSTIPEDDEGGGIDWAKAMKEAKESKR